jgi:hypothetical protein
MWKHVRMTQIFWKKCIWKKPVISMYSFQALLNHAFFYFCCFC